MSVSAPTPPLLLTKRLTAFLHSNLTPQVHTALIATLSGKLLAHASTQSVNTLRTQCTVAASLWAIYSAPDASDAIADSLPPHQQHPDQTSSTPTSTSTSTSTTTPPSKPSAITIQLTGAVMVLRLLRCGLLFVCFGPPPSSPPPPSVEGGLGNSGGNASGSGSGSGGGSEHTTQSQQQGHGQDRSNSGSAISQPSQPQQSLLPPPHEANLNPTPTIGSPSEVASIKSTGGATVTSIATTTTTAGSVSAGTAGVVAVRRQAEDLARWLDDKLGSLGVPEEGAAFESR